MSDKVIAYVQPQAREPDPLGDFGFVSFKVAFVARAFMYGPSDPGPMLDLAAKPFDPKSVDSNRGVSILPKEFSGE